MYTMTDRRIYNRIDGQSLIEFDDNVAALLADK